MGNKYDMVLKFEYNGKTRKISHNTLGFFFKDPKAREFLKSLFGEDLLWLIEYALLGAGKGFNLRNKVAHTLVPKGFYILQNLHLLFFILLKLCKVRFLKTKQN